MARMAPLSSQTLNTRRCGKRSKLSSNCSTNAWYRALPLQLLFHREDHDVGRGGTGNRGLERVITIRQGGHLNRDLIESREAGRERRAKKRGIGGAYLDADRAGIVHLVPRHLNAGGDRRG